MTEAKANSSKLGFDDLVLETIVLEIRYDIAYLFWDYAGRIWKQISDSLSDRPLVLRSANPSSVVVICDNKYEIAVESTRFSVSVNVPMADFADFLKIVGAVFDIVVEKLALQSFTRLGIRQIYTKRYDTYGALAKALQSTPFVSVPKYLAEENKPAEILASTTIRVEKESRGMRLKLGGAERVVEMTIPPQLLRGSEESYRRENHFLLTLDLDAYTKNEVVVAQLSIKDWANQSREAAKKEGARLF